MRPLIKLSLIITHPYDSRAGDNAMDLHRRWLYVVFLSLFFGRNMFSISDYGCIVLLGISTWRGPMGSLLVMDGRLVQSFG